MPLFFFLCCWLESRDRRSFASFGWLDLFGLDVRLFTPIDILQLLLLLPGCDGVIFIRHGHILAVTIILAGFFALAAGLTPTQFRALSLLLRYL